MIKSQKVVTFIGLSALNKLNVVSTLFLMGSIFVCILNLVLPQIHDTLDLSESLLLLVFLHQLASHLDQIKCLGLEHAVFQDLQFNIARWDFFLQPDVLKLIYALNCQILSSSQNFWFLTVIGWHYRFLRRVPFDG